MVFSKDLNYFFSPIPQTLFRIHRAAERVRLPQSGAESRPNRPAGSLCAESPVTRKKLQ
jgi:hypothetical protein